MDGGKEGERHESVMASGIPRNLCIRQELKQIFFFHSSSSETRECCRASFCSGCHYFLVLVCVTDCDSLSPIDPTVSNHIHRLSVLKLFLPAFRLLRSPLPDFGLFFPDCLFARVPVNLC